MLFILGFLMPFQYVSAQDDKKDTLNNLKQEKYEVFMIAFNPKPNKIP
jgi:hypothetical protein